MDFSSKKQKIKKEKKQRIQTFDGLLDDLLTRRNLFTLDLHDLINTWDKLEEISVLERRKSLEMLEYLVQFIQIGFEIMPEPDGYSVTPEVRYLLDRLSYYLDRRWSPKLVPNQNKDFDRQEPLPSKAATRGILKNHSLSRSMPEVCYLIDANNNHIPSNPGNPNMTLNNIFKNIGHVFHKNS